MTITRKKVADDLTRIFENCRTEIADVQTMDREQQARDGAVTISTSIQDYQLVEKAKAAVDKARSNALEVIEAAAESAERELIKAPSTESANYIVSITGRDDMKEREVRAALERYTDHVTQHAILAAANRSGLHSFGDMTTIERYLDELENLENSVRKTYVNYIAFMGMSERQAEHVLFEYKAFEESPGFDALDSLFSCPQII